MDNSIKNLDLFIFPLKDFSLEMLNPNFEFVFDEEENISLKTFDYSNNIENVDSDQFSISDRSQLQMEYRWGLRFDCTETEKYKYLEMCNFLLLTFRIFNRSDCGGIYLLNVTNPHLSVKEDNIWKYAIANRHNHTHINVEELEKIKIGYKHLKSFYTTSPRTKHSTQFLYLGYISNYWMQAYILFMTALETLVSPDKIGSIVSEVTDRVVHLVDNKEICSKSKFDKIYDLRSDIIHGKVLVELNFEKEMVRLQQLQRIILEVFKILLNRDFKNDYRNEDTKEDFYKIVTLKNNQEKHS